MISSLNLMPNGLGASGCSSAISAGTAGLLSFTGNPAEAQEKATSATENHIAIA
jgi:hypothetical protein